MLGTTVQQKIHNMTCKVTDCSTYSQTVEVTKDINIKDFQLFCKELLASPFGASAGENDWSAAGKCVAAKLQPTLLARA